MNVPIKPEHPNVHKKDPKYLTYPFFLFHQAIFSIFAFMLIYGEQKLFSGFIFGVFGITGYLLGFTITYWIVKVKWMLIGGMLGVFQIYGWLGIIATYFIRDEKSTMSQMIHMATKNWPYLTFAEMPFYYHVIPGTYIILYMFLIRNLIIDLLWARENPLRMKIANGIYLFFSGILFAIPYFS